ncbi:unnamed protein product [Rotaria magnacalcarata]|uniref:Uncharacterized protein n=2 Tax=Rotaria magnacalcarata TaxID=392030 RepID=A0A816ZF52_9BILA|nr:unnamed protein product [Rotaria magnacalcarata]
MSSSSNNHRIGLDKPSFDRNQFMTKRHESNSTTNEKSENNESVSTVKKSDALVSTNPHRKFDAWRQQNGDGQDKGSDEPYIREYKDFAGVTIIIRTVVDPRAFASLDPNSKSNLQAMRRKSELSQSQANTQDKVERTEKADHAGTNNPTVTSKSDTSSGNSHDSAAGDKHH